MQQSNLVVPTPTYKANQDRERSQRLQPLFLGVHQNPSISHYRSTSKQGFAKLAGFSVRPSELSPLFFLLETCPRLIGLHSNLAKPYAKQWSGCRRPINQSALIIIVFPVYSLQSAPVGIFAKTKK